MTAHPLVFGEVLFDRFPDGSEVLGGAPFNVAWHLQAFGCTPLLVSSVGNDALGQSIRAAMADWGMPTTGLQQDLAHPTGTVEVSLQAGEPHYDIVAERAYDYIGQEALPSPIQPRLIYHGSLALRNAVSRQTLAHLTQQYAAPVFVDINLRPPWWEQAVVMECLAGARWAKLNADELATLVLGVKDTEAQAKALLEIYNLSFVLITLGAQGALVVTDQGQCHQVMPATTGEVVDTVGAGDAFASVCILGLLQGWELELTLTRAQAFASALVCRRGATVNDPRFYRALLEQWG